MKTLVTWIGITAIVLCSTAGDVLISKAMKRIGDLGLLRRQRGLSYAVLRVLKSGIMWSGICFMAVSFFSLMFTLSRADVSLVAPASASLTFITNAGTARTFLHEHVDRRRWIAAVLVAGGVALVAK
jgi:drug/metabolite transporter (DMT)-like permease